jgi:YesN/AraC family two-component response regulator
MQDDFQIVLEAENGAELLQKLNSQQPAIVLLDLRMPVLSGKQALLEIKKRFPEVSSSY